MITPIANPAAAPLESPPDEPFVEIIVGDGDFVVNIGASTDVGVGATMPVEVTALPEVGAEELKVELVTLGKFADVGLDVNTVSKMSKLSVGSAIKDTVSTPCLATRFCCNRAMAGSASRILEKLGLQHL